MQALAGSLPQAGANFATSFRAAKDAAMKREELERQRAEQEAMKLSGNELGLGEANPLSRRAMLPEQWKDLGFDMTTLGQSFDAENGGMPPLAPEDIFKREKDLRGEYEKKTGDFKKVTDAYVRLEKAGKDPSAAGDLALIFNYMKTLDPGSVVRESEFANAAATGAFGERIKAAVGRVVSGERLSPAMRQDFIHRGRMLYQGALEQNEMVRGQFGTLSEQYQVDPTRVVQPYGVTLPEGWMNQAPPQEPSPAELWTQEKENRLKELMQKAGMNQ